MLVLPAILFSVPLRKAQQHITLPSNEKKVNP
jgi:hypothetical protein